MKKFTLTLIAAIFAIGAFAQSIDEEKLFCRFGNQVSIEDALPAANEKDVLKRGSYVIPFDEDSKSGTSIVGGYNCSFATSATRAANPAMVVKSDATSKAVITLDETYDDVRVVTISGLADFGQIVAYYLPEDKEIVIPEQSVYYTSSYGWCKLRGYQYDKQSGMWYYYTNVTATVKDDGTIDFGDFWFGLIIQSGVYQGYRLGNWYLPNTTLTKNPDINGIMEYNRGKSHFAFGVSLQQFGNNVIVDNFMNYGNSVVIQLKADNILEIPLQPFYDGGAEEGVYYIVGLTSNNYIDYPLFGKWTTQELSWTSFTGYSLEGWWMDKLTDASVYYVNNACQRYNYSDPAVAASAPTFTFDGGTTGIQNAKAGEAVSESYVDMAGRQVTAATKGIVLKTTTYADGTKKTVKVIRK